MPNRVIKESIKRSPQIDSLTWFEEVVFYRLIVSADDYGCYDGRYVVIRNELFPTKENITTKSVKDAIQRLATAGLLLQYEVNGMPYLFFPTWEKHQRIRNKHRKYPEPPRDICLTADCGQMAANRPPESESESNPNPNPPIPPPTGAELGFGVELASVFDDWLQYKHERRENYKPVGLKTLITQVRNNAAQYGESAVAEMIRNSMASNWKQIYWNKLEERQTRNGKSNDARSDNAKADEWNLSCTKL